MPPKESLKRKGAPQTSGRQERDPKRSKMQESRTILAQSSQKILNENGELDVGSFVKSREFEIKALEQGIKSSKHALSTRAFQHVPREMRRRTASHNVKKLPKRLRLKAAREIKQDNTPTGSARKKDLTSKQHIRRETAERATKIGAKAKTQREALAASQAQSEQLDDDPHGDGVSASAGVNEGHDAPSSIQPVHGPQPKKDVLKKPAKPVTKFRKRQKDKTWLPTHMFHAKRAHMTTPSEPLWRFAIPLSPTEKAYRITHRAANLRGCVAWDMSYMSTIMLDGVEASLLNLLRRLGVPGDHIGGKKGEKWRKGMRSWGGWLHQACDKPQWIANALIIWCVEDQAPLMDLDNESENIPMRRRLILRTHPAGFLQLWNEVLRTAKEQRPAVMVEDLRFDIGSIEIEGPQAAEALAGVLHELPRKRLGETRTSGIDWPTFARTSSASLVEGALANMVLLDPRLRHPPRPVDLSSVTEDDILQMMATWPGDSNNSPGQLFDRDARHASCTLQSSQKAINRRKGNAGPGELPESLSSDPKIPALLCGMSSGGPNTRQNSWTLLLPWNWVLPVWNSLVYCPLSTGGNPRFGGLDEKRQLCFEQNAPWFPADYPGTQAGWNWELRQQQQRRRDWEKRPKGKRIEWASVDLGGDRKGEIGSGWACDWEYLFGLQGVGNLTKAEVAFEDATAAEPPLPTVQDDKDAEKLGAKGVESGKQVPLPENIVQLFAGELVQPNFQPPERGLLSVKIRLLHRGVPTTCARIYRLPRDDDKLRERWLAYANVRSGNSSQTRTQHTASAAGQQHTDEQGASQYPRVPKEEDLIGFVTTGNFNLGEGCGTGIGCIALAKVWKDCVSDPKAGTKGSCIVREAGTSIGRLAEWTAA